MLQSVIEMLASFFSIWRIIFYFPTRWQHPIWEMAISPGRAGNHVSTKKFDNIRGDSWDSWSEILDMEYEKHRGEYWLAVPRAMNSKRDATIGNDMAYLDNWSVAIWKVIVIVIFAIHTILFPQLLLADDQHNQSKEEQWQGKLLDGTTITASDLARILEEHRRWLGSHGKEGVPASLAGADLSYVCLVNVDLSEANLAQTNLWRANMANANMMQVDLRNSSLSYANLQNANLYQANLSNVEMRETNLTNAYLCDADLNEARLIDVDLQNADLSEADLSRVFYAPKTGHLPDVVRMAAAKNLCSLNCLGIFSLSYGPMRLTPYWRPHALVELREAFKKAGFRRQEREVTYAVKHCENQNMWKEENFTSKIESIWNYSLFELPCLWGMSPSRPLLVVGLLILLFSLPYTFAIRFSKRRGAIWVVRLQDRVLKSTEKERRLRITGDIYPKISVSHRSDKIKATIVKWLRMGKIGLYFSLLSAFRIGWRDLNVGNWITRIQAREYDLRATGWVRTISGIQSLITVYLLALWVLTYFGRPFE